MHWIKQFCFKKLFKNSIKQVINCPFHQEKTPSCLIMKDDSYHCLGCGRKGKFDATIP